jgi:hypothetical protein
MAVNPEYYAYYDHDVIQNWPGPFPGRDLLTWERRVAVDSIALYAGYLAELASFDEYQYWGGFAGQAADYMTTKANQSLVDNEVRAEQSRDREEYEKQRAALRAYVGETPHPE